MAHRVITTRWLHINKKLQFLINPYLWPLKYPRANKSPNLFLQKCKQQHLDKLKEVKGVLHPWPVFWLIMHFSQKLQHIGNK